MKPLNSFILRLLLKSEMKRNNQVAGMSSIFYEITRYMTDNYQHYDTISSHRFPSFVNSAPQTVNDFIEKCQRDAKLRLEHEKLGLDSGA